MCTVMVVENRKMAQNWLKDCILHSNIEADNISLCETVEDATHYLHKNRVDIVLIRLQKEGCHCIDITKSLKTKSPFSIVLGYGACKDFDFLCNAINSGVSKYLEDIFDQDRIETFLNEAYEKYCTYKIKLKSITLDGCSNTEIVYSNEILKEWVDSYSRNSIEGNNENIDGYIDMVLGMMDKQSLYHSKSMILEIIIIINDKINSEDLKSDYTILNSKSCCSLMQVDTLEELKNVFSTHMKKLSNSIHILTSASDHKSMSIISATSYIKNNYQKDISRDDVASAVNLNPSYFSKFFKEQMGESFVEYLRRIRIEEAIRRLENTSETVKEISAKVGYIDSKYFSRLFFKHTGYTPGEYRRCILKLMA